MKEAIELLKKHDLLKIIDDELDIYLEIPHIAILKLKKKIQRQFYLQIQLIEKTIKNLIFQF